jgi:hypothetical protein
MGCVAVVDDSDYDEVKRYKWRAHHVKHMIHGIIYASSGTGSDTILMHRLIMKPTAGLQVDHINRATTDNRRGNLRVCTASENMVNRIKRPGSSSDYRGVCFVKRTGKWRASIKIKGKAHYLGTFDNEIDAAMAYDARAPEFHGQYAILNFGTTTSAVGGS